MKMPSEKRKFGDVGEEKAVEFLRRKGYKILEKNWACKNFGEIDIIAAKKRGLLGRKIECVIFVEVKTIKSDWDRNLALAAQNVHYQKQQRLIKTAQIYLAQKNYLAIPWQIDVILVADEQNGIRIEHLENAVWKQK